MAPNSKVLDTISALYKSLTKTEKKIADALMAYPDAVSNSSLSELAAQFAVGEATFVRFCRTLGFKGFSDFKLAYSIDMATGNAHRDDIVLEAEIMPDDNSLLIAQKLQTTINNVMGETIGLLDFQQLEGGVTG